MAPSTRRGGQDASVVDGLRTVYGEVSNLALAPDAGPYAQVIDGLRQMVLKTIDAVTKAKAQQAAQMQAQQAGGVPGGNPMMGGPQPGTPGPPRPQPGTPGGPPSQGSPGIAMPNPDELRRVMAMAGGGGGG